MNLTGHGKFSFSCHVYILLNIKLLRATFPISKLTEEYAIVLRVQSDIKISENYIATLSSFKRYRRFILANTQYLLCKHYTRLYSQAITKRFIIHQ